MRPAPRTLTDPWLISESGRQLVLGVWSRGELHQDVVAKAMARAEANRDGKPLEYSRVTKTTPEGVCIIAIDGPLFRKAGLLSEISGATSYDQIRQDLRLALADQAVRAVMLNVNSPGGEANGCSELADEIFAARSTKAIWSYVGGLGQSAGCWLYSAASHVVCSETALLGCIGVRQSVIDTSKSDEQAGIKVNDIVNDESPEKRDYPVDDEVIGKVKRQVNALAEVFISAMARNRDVSEDKVKKDFGRGDSLVGRYAVEAGLADEIGSLESAIGSLVASLDAATLTPTGASTMANPSASAKAGDDPKKDDEKDKSKAEDPKKESKAADMQKCADCDGEGKNPDGSECKTCDGEGEYEKKAKAGDGDGDEDDKPKSSEEDGEAKKAMAAMAGLSASASLAEIAATLNARTAPLSLVANLQKENATLSAAVEELRAKSIGEASTAFVDAAIRDGRSMDDKREHLVNEYSKAERAKSGSGPKALEPQLFTKGTFTALKRFTDGKGKPLGKQDAPPTSLAQDEPGEVRAKYAAKATAIAKAEKITFGAAMSRVKAVDPELYAAYAALPVR